MVVPSSNKVLFFFTDEFPYASGETFIENEIESLADNFQKIIIVTKNVKDQNKREIPDNVVVMRNDFQLNSIDKLLSVFQIFTSYFIKELIFVAKNKIRFSKVNISYMLLSLMRGKKIAAFIKDNISQYKNSHDIYLYSYWCMDESIGISLFKRRNSFVKAFTRAHRMDLYFYSNSNGYLPYKQLILDSLDTFFSISKDGVNYLKDKLHLKFNDVVQVSYLGTKEYISIDDVSIRNDSNRIMSCSNIYPNKRVHLIPEALQLIDFSVKWVHFGEYMDFTNHSYKAKLESDIKSLEKTNHQYTLKGRISNVDLMSHLKEKPYDLFVNVSESEGVPVSIMEAFSFGIPVIATNVGGVSEIVFDNINGFLLEPNPKPEDIAKKINDFYRLNLAQKNELRINAFQTWNKKFNSKVNYQNFTKTVLEI